MCVWKKIMYHVGYSSAQWLLLYGSDFDKRCKTRSSFPKLDALLYFTWISYDTFLFPNCLLGQINQNNWFCFWPNSIHLVFAKEKKNKRRRMKKMKKEEEDQNKKILKWIRRDEKNRKLKKKKKKAIDSNQKYMHWLLITYMMNESYGGYCFKCIYPHHPPP